jgi:hypothetical protein
LAASLGKEGNFSGEAAEKLQPRRTVKVKQKNYHFSLRFSNNFLRLFLPTFGAVGGQQLN